MHNRRKDRSLVHEAAYEANYLLVLLIISFLHLLLAGQLFGMSKHQREDVHLMAVRSIEVC